MKKGINILAIVLIMISLLLFGYSAYLMIFKDNDIENSSVKEKNTEVLLEDENIKNDILTKFYAITGSGKDGKIGSYTFRYGSGVFGNVFGDFNNDLKLRVVLDYFYNNNLFENLREENYSDPTFANFTDGIFFYISEDTVVEQYRRFYGSEPTLKSINNPEIGCFGYTYSPEKKLFFKIRPTCGGETPSNVYSYVNRFVVDGDMIYLYVNYGISKEIGSYSDDKVTIYKDLDFKDVFKSEMSRKDANGFRINESNCSDFSEYKFTFKKDNNNNYYFVSIE